MTPFMYFNLNHALMIEPHKKQISRGPWRRLLLALVLLGAMLFYITAVTAPIREVVLNFNHAVDNESATTTPSPPPLVAEVKHTINNTEVKSPGLLVDTDSCKIPDLPSVNFDTKQFFKKQATDPNCSSKWSPMTGKKKQRGPPLVQSNLTAMWVVREAMHHYNVSDLSRLACCYRPFWRVQDDPFKYKKDADNHASYSKTCVAFGVNSSVLVNSSVHFARVECSLTRSEVTSDVYRDFHAFVPTIEDVEERCSKSNRTSDQLSILIIGLDSVSRLNMLRQLPKTYQLLTSPPFSAISLLGYNKVGDNTFPNLVPLLTGLSVEQLRKKCYSVKKKIDDCPFIWKDFAARGYRTAYGEDATEIATFNYNKVGFVEQPTDYYIRPFIYESLKQQGHVGSNAIKLCTGPRQSFENFLSYVKKFATRFSTDRSFGFFWSSMVSHQDMNMPHIGDKLLAGALTELRDSGALERTLLVLMSDHGMRFGKFRETYQGEKEGRLPFLMLSFPEWFRRRFPEAVANLQVNADNRLTTPFDVHETLRDLLQPAAHLHSDVLRARVRDVTPPRPSSAAGNTTEGRGVSLFVAISPLRTCEDAAISPHWCTCQDGTPVSSTSPVVKNVVDFVVSELNKQLHAQPCETLRLVKIKSAEEKRPHEGPKDVNLVDYLVVFETKPGDAVFEATVQKTWQGQNDSVAKFALAGPVSRLNKYGNQSSCVKDSALKLYCYCKTKKKSKKKS